jgi:hypothetical protein
MNGWRGNRRANRRPQRFTLIARLRIVPTARCGVGRSSVQAHLTAARQGPDGALAARYKLASRS